MHAYTKSYKFQLHILEMMSKKQYFIKHIGRQLPCWSLQGASATLTSLRHRHQHGVGCTIQVYTCILSHNYIREHFKNHTVK